MQHWPNETFRNFRHWVVPRVMDCLLKVLWRYSLAKYDYGHQRKRKEYHFEQKRNILSETSTIISTFDLD